MPVKHPISVEFPGIYFPYQNAFNFEIKRLASFKDWKKRDIYVNPLAKTGLVYTGREDEVYCYCCPFTYKDWTPDKVPRELHQSLSPECPIFTQTLPEGIKPNIGIPSNYNKNGVVKVWTDYCLKNNLTVKGVQEFGLQRNGDKNVNHLQFPGVQMRGTRERVVNQNIPTLADGSMFYTATEAERMKHPQFATGSQREGTFKGFPLGQGTLSAQICHCGFFYTGYSDIVICFYCGLGIYKWEDGDDPKIVHARWRCDCGHFRNVVSPAFIEAVQSELAEIGNGN